MATTNNPINKRSASIRFTQYASGGPYHVSLEAPASIIDSVAFKLPSTDGAANQVLGTDGSGNLIWLDANAAMTLNSLLDVSIINPQSNDIIYAITDDAWRNAQPDENLIIQSYDVNTSITDQAETRSESIDMNNNDLEQARLRNYRLNSSNVNASSTTALDLSEANAFVLSQDVNIDTFEFNNPSDSMSFKLIRVKDGTGTARTIAWPASVLWSEGEVPELTQSANAVDVFSFRTIDGGTRWFGFNSSSDLQ